MSVFDVLGLVVAAYTAYGVVTGKVIAKPSEPVVDVPVVGASEDGWSAVVWSGVVRVVRQPLVDVRTVEPCGDEVAAALSGLNARIDAAQVGVLERLADADGSPLP